jgi:hypothetical protein
MEFGQFYVQQQLVFKALREIEARWKRHKRANTEQESQSSSANHDKDKAYFSSELGEASKVVREQGFSGSSD